VIELCRPSYRFTNCNINSLRFNINIHRAPDARSAASHLARTFIRVIRTWVNGVPIFRAWLRQLIILRLNLAAARRAVPPPATKAESCSNSGSVQGLLFMIDSFVMARE
jgi:hypothetical protein